MKPIFCSIISLFAAVAQSLPDTEPLTTNADISSEMVAGIDSFLMRELEAARTAPVSAGNRERFRHIIGLKDRRVPFDSPSLLSTLASSSLIAKTSSFEVHRVSWPVLDGVTAEGLLLKPFTQARMNVVAIPDADQTPESVANSWAGRLAANGCLVLIPTLIDRANAWSGNPRIRMTNQPHREFIYRMAYQVGRHIIGYEVQKVLAAVDWFSRSAQQTPIGVWGYGEGGLIAFHSAAADERIGTVTVSGYFGPRTGVWQQPIYRNIWTQLRGFRDIDLAALITPRRLIIEAAPYPAVAGPPAEQAGRRGAAPGTIKQETLEAIRVEAALTKAVFIASPGEETFQSFLQRPVQASVPLALTDSGSTGRMERQFRQLVDFTQGVVRRSEFARKEFWSKASKTDLASWEASIPAYRQQFEEEITGRITEPFSPLNVKTRRIYDQPAFSGYEAVIPVFKEVFAYGILLVPKDLKPNERRPLVVAQHGLEGRPQDLVDPLNINAQRVYQRFAARLAERGFIVFVPQNPYIFGERFRILSRKGNPLGRTLFSFITPQHQRSLDWLSTLPFVDGNRIGFYGLSYGGKTAMRVPVLEPRYKVVVCSGDFNEWISKITSVDQPFSYMFTHEYEILEFDSGDTFNHAESAFLIFPRPFMVERGHYDGVGIDEWISSEFAKVRRHYADFGLSRLTEIEYFKGPHQIFGNETFQFLHKHLGWP